MAGNVENSKYFVGFYGLNALSQGPTYPKFKEKWASNVPILEKPEFSSMSICGKNGDQLCPTLSEFKGWVTGKHDKEVLCTGYTAFAYDAMVTMAVVFDRMLSVGKTPETITSQDWFNGLKDLQDPDNAFECLSAGKVVFDENQDRRASYQIFHHSAGLLVPAAVGKVESGKVQFCTDAGIDCDVKQLHWPYNTDSESVDTFPGGVFNAPVGSPPACDEGYTRSGADGCAPCRAGFYCPKGTAEPVPCPAGGYCLQGTIFPTPCPAGTHNPKTSQANRTACTGCRAGFFGDTEGKSACQTCDKGYFSGSGQQSCTPCAIGTFATSAGSSSCTTCPNTFTTEFRATKRAEHCTCKEGTFWNRRNEPRTSQF